MVWIALRQTSTRNQTTICDGPTPPRFYISHKFPSSRALGLVGHHLRPCCGAYAIAPDERIACRTSAVVKLEHERRSGIVSSPISLEFFSETDVLWGYAAEENADEVSAT